MIERRDDSEVEHYRKEGSCTKEIKERGMIQERDDAGGHYKREGSCRREGIIEGTDDAEKKKTL